MARREKKAESPPRSQKGGKGKLDANSPGEKGGRTTQTRTIRSQTSVPVVVPHKTGTLTCKKKYQNDPPHSIAAPPAPLAVPSAVAVLHLAVDRVRAAGGLRPEGRGLRLHRPAVRRLLGRGGTHEGRAGMQVQGRIQGAAGEYK